MLKRILGAVVVALLLFLVFAAISPKTIKVNESTVINAPKSEVFNKITSLKFISEQTVWQKIDPNVQKTYTGTDGQVGSVYRWESDDKNVGVGEQEIIEINDGQSVVSELRFYKPWESVDKATMLTNDAAAGGTELTWQYESQKIPFPMNGFVTPFITPKLKKQFKESLENIKTQLEG